MGECKKRAVVPSSRVAVDTFTGRIQVEWDPDASVTPLGKLPFFFKRRIQGEVLITDDQLKLAFIETEDGTSKYEYQVLVTSMQNEILTIAQLIFPVPLHISSSTSYHKIFFTLPHHRPPVNGSHQKQSSESLPKKGKTDYLQSTFQ